MNMMIHSQAQNSSVFLDTEDVTDSVLESCDTVQELMEKSLLK